MRNNKRILILGHGYVGQAMSRFFSDHFDVSVYDPKYLADYDVDQPASPRIIDDTILDIESFDLAVVCVPTKMNDDGTCDTSIVEEMVHRAKAGLILIKSTVVPTTTQKLINYYTIAKGPDTLVYDKEIVFSPEYIGEGNYEVQWWKDKGYPHPTDMKKHDFVILGGNKGATKKILEYFKTVLGPDPRYFQTDATTAEICKYMENSWGATKVRFCNEFRDIAQMYGSDYNELRELFLADGRTERMHTAVFEWKRGFGGKCFPKDINAIYNASKQKGFEPTLLKSVIEGNDKLQKKEG